MSWTKSVIEELCSPKIPGGGDSRMGVLGFGGTLGFSGLIVNFGRGFTFFVSSNFVIANFYQMK